MAVRELVVGAGVEMEEAEAMEVEMAEETVEVEMAVVWGAELEVEREAVATEGGALFDRPCHSPSLRTVHPRADRLGCQSVDRQRRRGGRSCRWAHTSRTSRRVAMVERPARAVAWTATADVHRPNR